MRWRVLTAAGILTAILLGGAWCQNAVENHCIHVGELLLLARETGEADYAERAGALWEKHIGVLSALVNHEQLEAVGRGIALAESLLRQGQKEVGCAQIDAVLYLLGDVREYDHINLRTLL